MPDQPAPAPTGSAPALLDGDCGQQLPRGSVTRQLDFGQFVLLRADLPDPATGRTTRAPLVLDDSVRSVTVDSVRSVTVGAAAEADLPVPRTRIESLRSATGGLPVHLVLAAPDRDALVRALTDPPTEVTVAGGARDLLERGVLALQDGTRLSVDLSDDDAAALLDGGRLEVLARPVGGGAPRAVTLRVDAASAVVDDAATARLLAEGVVAVGGADVAVRLSRAGGAAVVAGRAARGYTPDGRVVGLTPAAPATPGTGVGATDYVVADVADFLWQRRVVRPDGSIAPASMDADAIASLRRDGVATVSVDGTPVTVATRRALDVPGTIPRLTRSAARVGPGADLPSVADAALGTLTTAGAAVALAEPAPVAARPDVLRAALGHGPRVDTPIRREDLDRASIVLPGVVPPPARPGLPVALMLAWRQSWVLEGYTRGELLHTVALAPGEETTIETFSWDRRTRRLEQSTETDVTLTSEVTETTKDTDECVREMTRSNDFQWNVGGTLDAAYRGVAVSVDVHAEAATESNDALKDVLKSTVNAIRERTTKAGTDVRSRRATRITETSDTGSEGRVTRRIRNANECHTLTLSYYEVLTHYSVRLTYLPSRLRLVVMVSNPFAASVPTFTTRDVRVNESALRRALLEPALADAFSAVRRLEAFAHAKRDLEERAAEAQRTAAALAAAKQAKPGAPAPPSNPVEAELAAASAAVLDAAVALRDPASVDPAAASTLAAFAGTTLPGAAGSVLADLVERARSGGLTARDVHLLAFRLMAEGGRATELAPVVATWLFRTLVAQVPGGPALLTALDDAAAAGSLATEDAVTLASLVPSASAGPAGCGSALAPTDDQVSRIYDEVFRTLGGPFPWSYGERFRSLGLWSPLDAGVVAALGRLQRAVARYDSRRSAPPLAADVVAAGEDQTAATTMDRLEFAFPLEEIAVARERQDALLRHLDEHADYYRYVLFQNLPPSSQLDHILESSGDVLDVGMFEPHAVGFQKDRLAIPISPTGEGALKALHTRLGAALAVANSEAEAAAAAAQETALTLVLPTSGVAVESSLGRCSACEDETVAERRLSRDLLQAELDRRRRRLEAGELGPFAPEA